MEKDGTSQNSLNDRQATNKGTWESVMELADGNSATWDSLSDYNRSDQDEATGVPDMVDVFTNSCSIFFEEALKYENGDLKEIPPLQLDANGINALTEYAKNDDGRKKIIDIIAAQARATFGGEEIDNELEQSEMSMVQLFGVFLLNSVLESSQIMSSEVLEQFRPQAELLKALGFSDDEFHMEGILSPSQDFAGLENLINLGLVTEESHNASRKHQIDEFFSELHMEVPERLQHLSEDANSYWNEQSRAAGCDALLFVLRMYESDINYENKNDGDGANVVNNLISESGRMVDALFGEYGLICIITEGLTYGSVVPYPYTNENYVKLIVHNEERFPEEKRWIIREAERLCFDENEKFSEETFSSFQNIVHGADGWDNSLPIDDKHPFGGPSDHFWNNALTYEFFDCDIIKEFEGYEASTSAEEKALLNIPFNLRREFIPAVRSGMNHYCPSDEFVTELLPRILNADGTMTESLAHLAARNPRVYEIAKKINPDFLNLFTPFERDYVNLPKGTREQLSKYLGKDDFKKLLENSSLEDASTIVCFSIGNHWFEDYIFESGLDFESLSLPPEVHTYMTIHRSYRDLIKNSFTDGEKDSFSPFGADAILPHISEFISENGPTQRLIDLTWDKGKFGLLVDEPIVDLDHFKQTDRQRRILEIYANMNDRALQSEFQSFISDENTDYEAIPDAFLEKLPAALSRMITSNASEVRRAHAVLAREIMEAGGDPEKKVAQIELIFLRNHLPYFAKAFLTFRTLHPNSRLEEKINGRPISPVLKAKQQNKSAFSSPEHVIFADMTNCAIKSNNRSVREFLEQVETGQKLVTQILDGKKDIADLGVAEKAKLGDFTHQLTILYNRTIAGQREPRSFSDNLSVDGLKELVDAFGVTDRYSLGDRIVRMYAFPAGFESLASAKTTLKRIASEQTERHRKLVEDGKITIEVGDIVKGLGSIQYIGNILQNGSLSKEYLGDSASSDATPLDTDVAIVLEAGNNPFETISDTAASGYGGEQLWAVMKKDDRFIVTRENPDLANSAEISDPLYDSSKLELFYTGVVGQDHYGIRTGFPSSDIDFFVKGGDTDRLELEIAKNGFYIPIVSPEGEIVFSYDDYKKLQDRMEGQSYYGNPDYVFGRLVTPETTEIAKQLRGNADEVASKRQAILDVVRDALGEVVVDGKPLTLKTAIDGDITPGFVELVDTGSTGRGTNVPGDGDFDFIMRLDRGVLGNPLLLEQIKSGILSRVSVGKPGGAGGDFRHKEVDVPGLSSLVDIDISFLQRTNKMEHSTDAAVRDVLASIAAESERERSAEIAELESAGLPTDNLGPTKYDYVIANIIAAKEFLKSAPVHAYKPARGDKPQGGLGGVGVENWILQHGGSFEDAAKDLLAAAREAEEIAGTTLIAGDETVNSSGGSPNEKVFRQFQKIYKVWDFGQNHFAVRDNENGGNYRFPHDNFVFNNMSAGGFSRMVLALRERFGE